MIYFNYKGIIIEVETELEMRKYRDSWNHYKTLIDRKNIVTVQFSNFTIGKNNLYELAMVKSTLTFFIQAYWKRRSKEGTKIPLSTSLEHKLMAVSQELSFNARQKNSIYSLEISLAENGHQSMCIYLSAQEVMMLEIAISKAIALLPPDASYINVNFE